MKENKKNGFSNTKEQNCEKENLRNVKTRVRINARMVAITGLMVALLEGGKIGLMAIPNVEVVSLLSAVFGYCFGFYGIIASIVFVIIETFVWGVGTWVISYFIYWPLFTLVFIILSKTKIDNRWIFTLIGVIMTAFFGFLTSVVDIGLFSGNFEDFWIRFAIYYARGVVFYAVHILSNLFIFVLLFMPLKNLVLKQKHKYSH